MRAEEYPVWRVGNHTLLPEITRFDQLAPLLRDRDILISQMVVYRATLDDQRVVITILNGRRAFHVSSDRYPYIEDGERVWGMKVHIVQR